MSPRRLQRRRVKGWRLPEGARIVDRTSRYGNPFTVADATADGYGDPQMACVELHAAWLAGEGRAVHVVNGRRFDRNWVLNHLSELRGRDLVCPCKPEDPCHADTLIAWANRPVPRPKDHGVGPKPYGFPVRSWRSTAEIAPMGGVL